MLTGEDGGLSALVVEDGTAKEIKPKIIWPWDEEESRMITAMEATARQIGLRVLPQEETP